MSSSRHVVAAHPIMAFADEGYFLRQAAYPARAYRGTFSRNSMR